MTRIAVYPGSFDPITYGHTNIIERGKALFDHIYVAVAENPGKQGLFPASERVDMIRWALGDSEQITVESFQGLLIDYASLKRATAIVRGLRAVSDFEFEFQLAHMNRRLSYGQDHHVETVFLTTGEEHFYLSSSLVREIASHNGPLAGLVPDIVAEKLRKRFSSSD